MQVVGELLCCNLLLAHGLKGQQTLETSVSIQHDVANEDSSSSITLSSISDGELKLQCTVDSGFLQKAPESSASDAPKDTVLSTLLLPGLPHSARLVSTINHPDWKQPHTGITYFSTDRSVSWNCTNYVRESSQRQMILDTHVGSGHCVGASVELLPNSPLKCFYNFTNLSVGCLKSDNKDEDNDEESVLLRGLTDRFTNFRIRDFVDREAGTNLNPDKLLSLIMAGVTGGATSEGFPRLSCSCSPTRALRALQCTSPEHGSNLTSTASPFTDLVEVWTEKVSFIKVSVTLMNAFFSKVKCGCCGKIYRFSHDGQLLTNH
jgi:redox-regulated HSP33 family molecular chaperone